MIIIGISGKKQSGKDECCNVILEVCKEKGLLAKRIAFADALKSDICQMCLVSPAYLEANKHMFRLIMQGYGTDFKRTQYPDYWVKRWSANVYEAYVKHEIKVLIVPDIRFENEFKKIRSSNGILIRVKRKSIDTDSHVSETEMDKIQDSQFNFTIENYGTLENFRDDVKTKLEMYKILCINPKTAQP